MLNEAPPGHVTSTQPRTSGVAVVLAGTGLIVANSAGISIAAPEVQSTNPAGRPLSAVTFSGELPLFRSVNVNRTGAVPAGNNTLLSSGWPASACASISKEENNVRLTHWILMFNTRTTARAVSLWLSPEASKHVSVTSLVVSTQCAKGLTVAVLESPGAIGTVKSVLISPAGVPSPATIRSTTVRRVIGMSPVLRTVNR